MKGPRSILSCTCRIARKTNSPTPISLGHHSPNRHAAPGSLRLQQPLSLLPHPCSQGFYPGLRTHPKNPMPGRRLDAHVLLFHWLMCLPGKDQAYHIHPWEPVRTRPRWHKTHLTNTQLGRHG